MRFPCPPGGLHHLIEHADEYGTILPTPTSRSSTWDMLRGGYGPGKRLQGAVRLRRNARGGWKAVLQK